VLTVVAENDSSVVVDRLELVAALAADTPVDVASRIAAWGATLKTERRADNWTVNMCVGYRWKRLDLCTEEDRTDIIELHVHSIFISNIAMTMSPRLNYYKEVLNRTTFIIVGSQSHSRHTQ
jgi:hypothetical protein